jgi:hypothetical protein
MDPGFKKFLTKVLFCIMHGNGGRLDILNLSRLGSYLNHRKEGEMQIMQGQEYSFLPKTLSINYRDETLTQWDEWSSIYVEGETDEVFGR